MNKSAWRSCVLALAFLATSWAIAPGHSNAAEPKASVTSQPPAELFPTDSRRWSRASEAKLVTDLSKAQPAAALTTGPREKGKWKVLPFAAGDIKGHALSTFRASESADVRIPLDTAGWHAVHVGVCTVSGGLDKADENGLRAKLSGESVYLRMANCLPLMKPRRDVVQERFLTCADLTGQSLDLASMPFKPATVCYFKLVPLTDEEVRAWQSFRPDAKTRTSVATFDGHSWIWPYRPRTKEHLLETFRGFDRTDIGKWWFQITGADLVCYPSQVGNIPGAGTTDFCRWEYEEYTKSLEAMFAAGVNPLKVAREEAARQGVEFHVMFRPTGWKGSLPWDEIFNSRFFDAHPEWRCIDRDGTPTLHMSYTYPEVRKQVLDVMRETLDLQPEGVGFLFHRGMPMMLWEQPFCDEFKRRHNADAREVAEDDPRILSTRAELMTVFLREVRQLLDETAARQKRTKPYKISLTTYGTEADNRKFGLDVERWAHDGLVNELGMAWFSHHTSFGPMDVAYYKRISQGTNVGVFPFVIAWHSGKPKELCTKVTKFYQDGASGIAIWDPMVELSYRDGSPGPVFDVASQLGHRDVIARWASKGPPLPFSLPLTQLGDNYFSRWFPNTGF